MVQKIVWKTFKTFYFADSVPVAKWCRRNECFLCSKHCFILFFNSFNFNFSCLLFLLKIWNYLFQKEVRRGFRILPLSNITYKQHKENISPCLLSLSLSPNTLPSFFSHALFLCISHITISLIYISFPLIYSHFEICHRSKYLKASV